jgi:hypothetical protein
MFFFSLKIKFDLSVSGANAAMVSAMRVFIPRHDSQSHHQHGIIAAKEFGYVSSQR